MSLTVKLSLILNLFLWLGSSALADGNLKKLQKQGRTDAIKESLSKDNTAKDLVFKNTLEFDNTLRKTEVMSDRRACAASLSIKYFEEDEHIRVDASLENKTCGASYGQYEIEIKTIDANGVVERETYSEQWQRSGSETLSMEHVYPLSDGVELLRAQSKLRNKDACWCAETSSETDQPE